jgi:hypothetical protein
MVLDVSRVYNGRPRLREQMHILADVVKIAATVQFLNIGGKFMESFSSQVPFLGRFADDIAQGIGAGLFTSVAGHATIERCRSFHGWSEAEARISMATKLKGFMTDLTGIASNAVWPALRGRVEAEIPEGRRMPNLGERVQSGIKDAIATTTDALDSCVHRPALDVSKTGEDVLAGAGRAVAWTGQRGWEIAVAVTNAAGESAAWAGKGMARAGETVYGGFGAAAGKVARLFVRGRRGTDDENGGGKSQNSP